MRKILALVAAIAGLLVLAACGGDGESIPRADGDGLHGTYVNQDDPSEYLELREDGTYFLQEMGLSLSGEWEVEDRTITLRDDETGLTARATIDSGRIFDEEGKVWVKEGGAQEEASEDAPTEQGTEAAASEETGLSTDVGAGGDHTCALTAVGGVKCWGDNFLGELGAETTESCYSDSPCSTTPVDVVGLSRGVAAIAVGGTHTCALIEAGGVKCWGNDSMEALGDGAPGLDYRIPTPVDVTGLTSEVVSVAAGGGHTCVLTTAGGVKCWGSNMGGQVGDGTAGTYPYSTKPIPVDVTGLTSGVVSVAAGGGHTCALTTADGVKCWGSNEFGQLGNEMTESCELGYPCSATPVDVAGLGAGVIAIAAGDYHTCALTTLGGIKCWGRNLHGQLGDGTIDDRTTPVKVVGLGSDVTAIAGGSEHTCALTSAGGVKCWGDNVFGQLGNGDIFKQTTPVDVMGLGKGVIAIAAGDYHTCALTTGGVKCWGRNEEGQLGDGTTTERTTPVDVVGLDPAGSGF